jgi:hypothetical protein
MTSATVGKLELTALVVYVILLAAMTCAELLGSRSLSALF